MSVLLCSFHNIYEFLYQEHVLVQCVQSLQQGAFFTILETDLGKFLQLSLSYDIFVIQMKDFVRLIKMLLYV